MRNGRIRTAVVGLGYFGTFHARQHAASPKAELVAVVDADPVRAAAVGGELGVATLIHHGELIGKVDAVSVTVPTSLHHEVAGALLDAGIHVLIEKPVAATPAEARDLIARAEARRAVLQVGHIERFAPAYRSLAGRVRRPLTIDATRIGPWKGRAVDVDVVLDLMIHDIDLVLALAGSKVSSVEAVGSAVHAPTSDFAHAILRFENGVVAHLTASRVADRAERTLRVVEAERVWTADLAARTLQSVRRGAPDEAAELVGLPASDNLAVEIDSFLDAVASGSAPVVGGRAGLEALLVAERILGRIAAPMSREVELAVGGLN